MRKELARILCPRPLPPNWRLHLRPRAVDYQSSRPPPRPPAMVESDGEMSESRKGDSEMLAYCRELLESRSERTDPVSVAQVWPAHWPSHRRLRQPTLQPRYRRRSVARGDWRRQHFPSRRINCLQSAFELRRNRARTV